MNTIVTHLWFDTEAIEASKLYASLFPDSEITHVSQIRDTPSGDCDIVSFKLMGREFQAISAGPYFKINPSISCMAIFGTKTGKYTREDIDTIWTKLADGGTILMPLQEYPFSPYYGWIQDKFGMSWQLMLDAEGSEKYHMLPSLLFVNEVCGKAEEAIQYYTTVFKDSKIGEISRYPKGMEPDKEGTIMYGDFYIAGQPFSAMDSAQNHQFNFNEAISFVVSCKTQEEIDYYWNTLSAVPEAEQCGWLKDKYGVSWQIVPEEMNTMMENGTEQQKQAVTQAFLPMKKFDIQKLREAYENTK